MNITLRQFATFMLGVFAMFLLILAMASIGHAVLMKVRSAVECPTVSA